MSLGLKKLEDQVVVITGASSGIGLVTARMASGRGARRVGGEVRRAGGVVAPSR